MIILKKSSEIAMMREAGRILARTMRLVAESIVPGKSTPKVLDALAERLISEAGGIASYKGYRGYPAATCLSVNSTVVHGIPDDRVLEEGDIIGIDLGVIKDGWHADSCRTYPVGNIAPNAQKLLNVTQEALNQGIAQARVGKTIGDVASTIQRYVERNGFHVVRELVGHGIGRSLHESPSVPNFGKPNKGPVIKEGLTICIEPMVNEGTHRVGYLDDGWTCFAADGKLSAHFEHTVAVTKDGPVILTLE